VHGQDKGLPRQLDDRNQILQGIGVDLV
jgi:hypothetical protein